MSILVFQYEYFSISKTNIIYLYWTFLFVTDLFILQIRLYLIFLGNLYIHVKCNAPLNGFIARYMAQTNTVFIYYYYAGKCKCYSVLRLTRPGLSSARVHPHLQLESS